MEQIKEFLSAHGLAVTSEEMHLHVERFVQEMRRGLQGDEASLKMIPTYIDPTASIKAESQKVIVIDAGGSNLRIALVKFDEQGGFKTEYYKKYPMIGTDEEISAEEFYKRLADLLRPIAGEANRIGICFSFPAEILPNCDAKILYFDKEIKIKGAEGSRLGENLLAAMRDAGMPSGQTVTVVNDTVAALLAAAAQKKASSYVGFVLGTGLNTCYMEENHAIIKSPLLAAQKGKTIINVESGGYIHMPLGDVEQAFLLTTKYPRDQIFEKMCSGAYQGRLFLAYLRQGAKERLFSDACNHNIGNLNRLSAKEIVDFCDNPNGENTLSGLSAQAVDIVLLQQIVDGFYHKIAFLLAVNLSAIMTQLGSLGQSADNPVCISAEGTTFHKSKLLQTKLNHFMTDYLETQNKGYFQFSQQEDATISGTALAGLLQ